MSAPPGGFAGSNQSGGHPQYRTPPAPPSLSPVTMNSARGSVPTSSRNIDIAASSPRPSAKTGFSILMAGALIGGLLGVFLHQQPADPMLAIRDEAPPSQVLPGTAQGAVQQNIDPKTESNNVVVPTGASPAKLVEAPKDPKVDASKDLASKDSKDKTDAKDDASANAKKDKVHAHGAVRLAAHAAAHPAAAPKETPEDPAAAAEPKDAKGSKKKDRTDDGYKIASAGGDDGASSAAAAAGKKADTKALAAPDAADANANTTKKKNGKAGGAAAASPGGHSAATDDAVNVLKAAMGATENTL